MFFTLCRVVKVALDIIYVVWKVTILLLLFCHFLCTAVHVYFFKNCPYIKPYIFAWGYFKPWIWHPLLTPIWHWPGPRDCTLQTVNLSCLWNTTSIPYFKKLLEVDILFYILHSEITTLCIGCPYSIGLVS